MIRINLEKARTIAHNLRRAARDREMAPFDAIVAKQIPNETAQAESERAKLRTKYQKIQNDIDAAKDVDELKAAIS